MPEYTKLIHKYLRHDKKFPHIWCPGCGNGILLGAMIRAIDRLGYEKDEVAVISGIGCTSRLPVYVDFHTMHTTHGRALTFATGVKLANPALKVIVIMGDGDATAIGGNHFIHAARRNLNITAIIMNNSIYGMTGGQFSPTTPFGAYASTAPFGNIEHAFSISELAACAGAVFVGRGTVYHVRLLDRLIEQACEKRGFSVVEVLTNCHVQFGRYNRLGGPVEMMKRHKEQAVKVEDAAKMSPGELEGKFTIGVLADREKPIYSEQYRAIREKAQEKAGRDE